MMISIYKIYGVSVSEGALKALAKTTVATAFGRSVVGNLIKLIPGLGSILGGVINAAVAATFTEVLGWATVSELEVGRNPLDDIDKFRSAVKNNFDEMKKTSS
jgi:uncharacterized protein (DUF697 family)